MAPRQLRLFLRLAAIAVVGAAASAASGGCTFLLDANAHQCETTADCSAFVGTVCNERHVCVEGGTKCGSNAQCIDRYGSETYFCKKAAKTDREGTCTQLVSKDCPTIMADPGDLRNDDAVILGLHGIGSWSAMLQGGTNSIELARRDFKAAGGGLPALPGGKARPVIVVACDAPLTDQDVHKPITDHLIDDLNVPGTIGPLPANFLEYFVGRSTQRGGPMLITTGNKFPGFENIPGTTGLFFTVGLPAEGKGRSEAYTVPVFEQAAIAADPTKAGKIKLAFVSSGVGVAIAVSQAFAEAAQINGKAAQTQFGSAYKEFNWGDTADPNFSTNLSNAVADVISFKPDIVVCDGAQCAEIPVELDQSGQLPTTAYIIGQEGEQGSLSDYVGTNESLRKRILGTHPGPQDIDPDFVRFLQRHKDVFKDPAQAQGFAAAAFDMAYELFYAVAAVGDKPITGLSIGGAIHDRFKAGGFKSKIADGTNAIIKAYGALSAGQTLDLQGITGPAYFDDTGQVVWKAQVWCIKKDIPTDGSTRFGDTGLQMIATDTALQGTNGCF